MKKLLLLFFVMMFVIVMAACGNNNASEQKQATEQNAAEEGTNTTEASLLDRVKDKGELLIGTEGTYRPFTYHDEKTGELTGFDVEIAREVAKRLGVEAVFMETQWDAMFAGLDAERFDMVANQVGIRPDRQEKYDFSDPYISSAAVLVAHKDNTAVKGFEDVKGLKSAQSLTSNYGDLAKSNGAELVSVEGFNQAIDLLVSKRVDVTFNDSLTVLDYLKQKPDAPVHIVARADDASQSGLMFRKGNSELVAAVNEALQAMHEDGTYLEISEQWFGEDVSK